MARLPCTATKAEREELHKAKMAGKKYDAARRYTSQPTVTQKALARIPAGAFARIAHANRHTLEPHTRTREIERLARQKARINANREARPGPQGGYVLAAGVRMNFSRRGNLVLAL